MTRMYCDLCGKEIDKKQLPYSTIDFNGVLLNKQILAQGTVADSPQLKEQVISKDRDFMCSFQVCNDCFTNVFKMLNSKTKETWGHGKCTSQGEF